MHNQHRKQVERYPFDIDSLDAFIEKCLSENNISDLTRLTTYLRRYISPLVVIDLLRSNTLPNLLIDRELDHITALIIDIRGFVRTTQSGEHSDQGLSGVAHLLRTFFSQIIQIAFEHRGFVGEFAGDRVLITFGFPDTAESHMDEAQQDGTALHIRQAVSTALAIQNLSEQIRSDDRFPPETQRFEVGIGICAGRKAWIGDIGTDKSASVSATWRQELTVISAGVNIAARAEELTKDDLLLAQAPTRKIIIDETTLVGLKQWIGASIEAVDLGNINVRGLGEMVHLYHLVEVYSALDVSQPITDSDRAPVDWICTHIDGAIERDMSLKMHRALAEVGQQITTREARSEQSVFEQIIVRVRESFNAHKASLYQRDPSNGELIVMSSIGPHPLAAGTRLSRGIGIAGMVAETGKPFITHDVHHAAAWRGSNLDPDIHAMVCVPLVAAGSLVGVLQLMDDNIGTFSEEDLTALNVFAGLAAVALDNARAYNQELRLTRGRAIITQAFSSAQSLSEVLNAVMEAICESLSARNATLYLVDQETSELVFEKIISESSTPPVPGTKLPPGTGIVGWVVANKQARLILNTQTDPDWYGRIGSDIRSMICTPLMVRGHILGVIQVLDNRPNAFDEHDLDVLTWLSASAAIAVNNAIQLDQARKKLIASEAIAGLGAISGKLAHNLKNQVGAIKAIARFQIKSDDPRIQAKIQQIITAADEALAEVKGFMQPLTGWAPSDVDICELLTILVNTVREPLADRSEKLTTRARIQIDLSIDDGTYIIYAGSDQIEYIFRNLIDNAVRAIDERGSGEGRIHVQLHHELLNEISWVSVEIADTGIGISPENLGRIFDLAYTTRPEGTIGGYGLFWVRLNIERLGGKITVQSERGLGTTFQVRLPIAHQ
jgi:signal transduction histidine kinase/class 3 adenylate cyclase